MFRRGMLCEDPQGVTGNEWIRMLAQEDRDNIVRMVTQAAQYHSGLTNQAKMDIRTKFELSPQKLEEVIQWVYSQEVSVCHGRIVASIPQRPIH